MSEPNYPPLPPGCKWTRYDDGTTWRLGKGVVWLDETDPEQRATIAARMAQLWNVETGRLAQIEREHQSDPDAQTFAAYNHMNEWLAWGRRAP